MTNEQKAFGAGRIAALVARACMRKDKKECTIEFAMDFLRKFEEVDLDKAKPIAKRVLKEVVSKDESPEALEKWAASVEHVDAPFPDYFKGTGGENGAMKSTEATTVAPKPLLQAAVKTLGMGPSAYKGLPKDDNSAYCEELQRRVLAHVANISGERRTVLPTPEEMMEMKKAIEAKKELSSLDASNIIQGRPKRRAASSAAEAIKRDIARDLEREAAQAASQPQKKKAKTDEDDKDRSAGHVTRSKMAEADEKAEKEEEGEDEEEEDSDDDEEGGSESGSEGSDDSSGSSSSDDEEEQEDDE